MEKEFTEHLNEKHPIIKFTAEWSQTSINFLDVTVEKLLQIYMSNLQMVINLSTLLHVTYITRKREFPTAKLFVLTESVQILILLIGDTMILKSG